GAAAVAVAGVLAGCLAHPLGRLRDQRLRRPLARRAGGTHPQPAAGHRRGVRARGAGGVRGSDAGRVRAGADPQPSDRLPELRRHRAGDDLSLPQALHLPAAGLPGHGLRLGHPDGLRRDPGRGAADRLGALRRQHPVVHRLRYLVRDGGPRRRHPHGREVHRDPVRRPRPGRAGRAVRAVLRCDGAGGAQRAARRLVLDRARGRAPAGGLRVRDRAPPRARCAVPRVPAQPLGRRHDLRRAGAGVVAAGRVNAAGGAGMLERLALRSAAFAERWFPDAWVFAVVGVLVVAGFALGFGASPGDTAQAFGGGFWSLIPFTMQMAFVVIGGYVVATAPAIARLIDRIARWPRTGRGAVGFVALASMLTSLLSWGLSLVFAGLLVRALAKRTELRMDYRAAGAAAYLGL